ncbi:Uncharacterized protein PECH_008383 [Penicillium ucsense]|uniref:Uncharacterized protein n=1 Tax=Penicillium ucsense TaxID=2839758 RepID=A0A8J8WLB7_9EURO|nr:Uncharacterized protein PECM_002080 [Penicillium ucsense]KAF7734208.1 Uncharacterized protein PECH_008383 [Penicillium ucsense]
MLFDDVKRTEPFARLARPEGATASASILEISSPWWVTLYSGFAKKKYGHRSWVSVCVSIVNVLGFLAISPLSSSFLNSQEMIVPRTVDFFRFSPTSTSPLPIDTDQTVHFRTIANLLQNVSTSPWITDNYTILPFWPADLKAEAITSLPVNKHQSWTAETMMFASRLTCEEMKIVGQSVDASTANQRNVSIIWSSSDGCKYGLSVSSDFFTTGGASWSNTSTFFYSPETLLMDAKLSWTNSSVSCGNRELIVATEPWPSMSQPGKHIAQICSTEYSVANVSVTVTLNGEQSEISFNETEFERRKTSIPHNIVNVTLFQDMTLTSEWNAYMISSNSLMGGASVILGALYDYNMTSLVNDPKLARSAAMAKQRFFGEALQSALRQDNAATKFRMNAEIQAVEQRVIVQEGPAIAMGSLFVICCLLLLVVWRSSRLSRRPLNLDRDPATIVGSASLVAQSPRTRSGFQSLRQPTTDDLQKRLGNERYYTDSRGLSKTNPDLLKSDEPMQSKSGTPTLLRLPALLGMIVALILIIAGVCVLFHYAGASDLYQNAFIYQFNVSFRGASMSSIAPFSMIPTILAIGIGLWWSAIDETFRRLQPYISMAKRDQSFRRGVSLSYQTSYWFWAASKAAHNRHWLLLLVALGSTLSPIYTTAMSALFNQGTGVLVTPIDLNRTLELRRIPHIYETKQSMYPGAAMDYPTAVLQSLYQNLSSYYMYTATVQLALNGSEPAWSKDGWSFVPLDIKSVSSPELLAKLGASRSDMPSSIPQVNITFTTPAIRGRIECSAPPARVFANLTSWTTSTDLSNHTVWNKSTIPDGVKGGYQLGNTYKAMQFPSSITPLLPGQNWTECPGCTTVFVNPAMLTCCGNGSTNSRQGSVAIGYWSPNDALDYFSPVSWQRNFTAKWFYGNAVTGIKSNKNKLLGQPDAGPLFLSPPSLSFFNCEPIVETASASITVDPSSGAIQSFVIQDTPRVAKDAFDDNFLAHNGSVTDLRAGYSTFNVTISYGHVFMSTLLTSADLQRSSGVSHTIGYNVENLDDNTFNIRDEMQGLNMDFMSYSMYSMANKDPQALLDPKTFVRLAQKSFTTFFQHFVSNNISMANGGWAYQTINASLPSDLTPAVEYVNGYAAGAQATAYQDVIHPISQTNRTVSIKVAQRVQLLQMNAIAVWLSVSIMAWLILTTLVVAIVQKQYFGRLVRDIESLGDVLVLIAGSANLLEVVRAIEAGLIPPDQYEKLRTRLGWFMDEDGELRWGVELVSAFGDGPQVEWIATPYFSKKGTKTWGLSDESVQS